MSSTPKISVLMPVYNGAAYLAQAIESVLGQTMGEFEFIIIDDGSTDHTAGIIRSFSDPRIVIVENGRNIGLTASLNKGLRLAKTQYIARQDADDISLPQRFERLYAFLERHPDTVLLGSKCQLIDDRGNILQTKQLGTGSALLKKRLSVCNQFCHGSVIFRKKTAEKLQGYRPRAKYVEDYDLWCRMARVGDMENLDEPLYQLRLHTESVSIQHLFRQKQYERLIASLYADAAVDRMSALEDLSDEELAMRLNQLLPENAGTINRAHSEKYFEWAEIMYHAKKYQNALQYLQEARRYRAWDRAAWLLRLKCRVKICGQQFL